MSTIKGVVERVDIKKSPAGSNRKWTKVAFAVADNWYSGFTSPETRAILTSIGEGDVVEIEYKTNGEYNNYTDVKLVQSGDPAPKKAESNAPVADVKPYSAQEKDLRITYNGSLKSAIPFVELLVKTESLVLPKKVADRADVLLEAVQTYTEQFVNDTYNCGQGVKKTEAEKEEKQEAEEIE